MQQLRQSNAANSTMQATEKGGQKYQCQGKEGVSKEPINILTANALAERTISAVGLEPVLTAQIGSFRPVQTV